MAIEFSKYDLAAIGRFVDDVLSRHKEGKTTTLVSREQIVHVIAAAALGNDEEVRLYIKKQIERGSV